LTILWAEQKLSKKDDNMPARISEGDILGTLKSHSNCH